MTEDGNDQRTAANGAMTVSEVTGLVNLFTSMLNTSTAQIIARIDDNAKSEAERWRKHDLELERNRVAVVERFLKIERSLDEHLQVANAHFTKERDEDIRLDARVRPVKSVVGWVWSHWRDLALLAIGLITLATLLVDALGHMAGVSPP